MKKFIFTIIVLLGTLMPTSALAQDGSTYREAYAVLELTTSEESEITDAWITLYYDDQKSTRKGTVVDIDKMMESPEIMQTREKISSVIFDQSFEEARPTSTAGWFMLFENLREIVGLNYLRTDVVTDMSSMFANCYALASLDISGFNTENVTNMSSMFANCYALASLDLSGFNTENVTNMSSMFFSCRALTSLDLSGFNTEKVTNMRHMFHECYSLISLNLKGFKTENVTDMESMFAACQSLTSLNLSGFNTENVTTMYYMFSGCQSLTSLELSGFNTKNVTTMAGMFEDCFALTSLDLSGFDTENVTKMENMFYSCSELESIDLTGFKTNNVTDMEAMFRECKSLTSLDLSGFNTESVTNMSGMFYACYNLNSIDLSGFNTENVTTISSMFAECENLTTLDLSGFSTGMVVDMGDLFKRCTSLKTIYVSDKWTVSDSTYGSDMFTECTSLIGGNGTMFNSDYTDITYARIDKQDQPGYFTDIADKGKAQQVTTPRWEFQNESDLALITETADASIYYAMETWDDESQADSIANALEVNTSSTLYTKPIQITDNVVIKMMAAKEGMENSKDTTFIYAYKLWYELYEVIRYGVDIADKATDNPKVEQSLVEELRWALNEGDHMYQMRAEVSSREAEYFIQAIMEACKKIEEQMTPDEQVATPTFSFNGDSLVISCTTEDALIWYQSAEIDSTFVDGWAQYTAPMFVGDIKINAKATKEGMLDSEIASMVYYYTEWQELIETTYICDKVLSEILQSKPSENITKMIDDVYVELAYVRDEYEGHRLEWDRDKIEDEIMKLKHVVAEIEEEWKKESSEATYENLTLTVGGANTMATALEMVGGRDEVTKDIAAIVWNSTEPLTKSDLEGFDNPNMLIFVNEASMAPEGVENVVVDGKAKSITLVDTDSINNNFYAPQEFTAESISYTREFKQTTQKDVSRGWEGICLPFTVQSYTHESHGAIAPFRNDNSAFHFWLHQMTEQGMATATNIEANMPYIISMPNNTSYPATYNQAGKVTFSAKNAVVPVSVPSMIHLADGSIGIAGVYNSLPKMEGFYSLNVGDDMDENPEGSVFVNNYRTIRPFEVYSYHASRSAGTRSIISVASLFTGGVDGATGILDATDKQDSDEVKVYSVNGILLKKGNRNEVMNSLPKGLYIIGNQKIMVK